MSGPTRLFGNPLSESTSGAAAAISGDRVLPPQTISLAARDSYASLAAPCGETSEVPLPGAFAAPQCAVRLNQMGATHKIKLTDDVVRNFSELRVMKDNLKYINGCDWSKDGETFITSSDDDGVQIYTLSKLKSAKHLLSRKYGVDMIKFAQGNPRHGIVASRPQGCNGLRLWDFSTNRFTQTFSIPSGIKLVRGNGIVVHPTLNVFMASCTDNRLRLFSLDFDKPIAMFRASPLVPNPVCAFDDNGLIFAAILMPNMIHLFDCANYSKGEMASITVDLSSPSYTHLSPLLTSPPSAKYRETFEHMNHNCTALPTNTTSDVLHIAEFLRRPEILSLQFAPRSNILVMTVTCPPRIIAVDTFTGEKVSEYYFGSPIGRSSPHRSGNVSSSLRTNDFSPDHVQYSPHSAMGFDDYCVDRNGGPPLLTGTLSVSADGQYVACGASDKSVHIWNLKTRNKVVKLEGHIGFPKFVSFNPKKCILATCDLNVALWGPQYS